MIPTVIDPSKENDFFDAENIRDHSYIKEQELTHNERGCVDNGVSSFFKFIHVREET